MTYTFKPNEPKNTGCKAVLNSYRQGYKIIVYSTYNDEDYKRDIFFQYLTDDKAVGFLDRFIKFTEEVFKLDYDDQEDVMRDVNEWSEEKLGWNWEDIDILFGYTSIVPTFCDGERHAVIKGCGIIEYDPHGNINAGEIFKDGKRVLPCGNPALV